MTRSERRRQEREFLKKTANIEDLTRICSHCGNVRETVNEDTLTPDETKAVNNMKNAQSEEIYDILRCNSCNIIAVVGGSWEIV